MDFSEFVLVMEDAISRLSLSLAIKCIMAHSQKGCILCVDELLKSGGYRNNEVLINGVVSAIGGCLDTLPITFNAIVTTLDATALTQEQIKSGRKINWVYLRPAKLDSALSLFGDLTLSPVLVQCISDCNGHFRSLETLFVLWQEVEGKPLTYPTLIKRLRERMDNKYGDNLTIDLIKSALRGTEITPSDSPDSHKSYREYLSMGIYLNSVKGEEKFVPRLSPLLLMLFAERETGPYADKTTSSYKCARVLLAMLELEPNFDDQQYEKFHAHWEVLYRILFSGEVRNLSSLYPSEVKNLAIDPKFTLSNKSVDLCLLSTHFPPNDKTLLGSVDLRNQVLVPYLGNPGFDIVYSEEQQGKGGM